MGGWRSSPSRTGPRDARDVHQGRASETEAQRLGGELSALRRIAMVVARAAPEPELLHAIAEEIAQLLGTEAVRIFRYDDDREAVVVAARGDEDELPLGSTIRWAAPTLRPRCSGPGSRRASTTFPKRRAVRSGIARRVGLRSVVAVPIMVAAAALGRDRGRLAARRSPARRDRRAAREFTELDATAIANAESRARGDRLADEQAALRRVATLVARASLRASCSAPSWARSASARADLVGMIRFDGGGTATAIATWAATASIHRCRSDGRSSRVTPPG